MRSNRLQLNAAKTEVICCASGRRQGQLPHAPFTVGSDAVKPVRCVRDLGIYLDSDVSMRTHASKIVASCFTSLRQIRSIQNSVSRPMLLSLVMSLVCQGSTATLAGVPAYLIDRLQSIVHAW